jgi:hypothetical protein
MKETIENTLFIAKLSKGKTYYNIKKKENKQSICGIFKSDKLTKKHKETVDVEYCVPVYYNYIEKDLVDLINECKKEILKK